MGLQAMEAEKAAVILSHTNHANPAAKAAVLLSNINHANPVRKPSPLKAVVILPTTKANRISIAKTQTVKP